MKILFLTTHLNAGGITSYLYILSKGFIANGCDVFIVSSGGDSEIMFKNIGVHLTNLNIKTKSELDLRIYLSLNKLKKIVLANNIDVIHSNTRITQVMGYFAAKSCKIPFVSTCHGFFKTRFFRLIFSFWGDKVIAISNQVRNHLINDFKVKEDRIQLIESGVDIDHFVKQEKSIIDLRRKELGLREDEFVLGIIARLSNVKGQDVLIDAMPKLIKNHPKVKLLIIGQGRTEKLLKQKVEKLDLCKFVEFIEIVNETQKMLSVLDLFVMPSRQEGLGISIIEAQSCQIPVAASNVGGIPSLIKDGQTGFLFEPENPNALADKIIYILNNKHLLNNIIENARAFVKANYSSEFMINNTLKFYRSLIK